MPYRRNLRYGLVVAVTASMGIWQQVAAQEALRTALESDAAARLRARPPVRPASDMLKVGPVGFDVGLGYSLEASDNVLHTRNNRQSDLIQRPSSTVGLVYQLSRQSRLDVRVGFGYDDYIDNTVDDRWFVTPGSEVALDVGIGDGVVTVYDRFDYSQDVVDEGALSGIAVLPRLQNIVGIRSVWQFHKLILQAGYSHLNVFVLDDEPSSASTTSTTFNHLERADEQFFGRVGYAFDPTIQAGVETSVSLSDYEEVTQRDRDTISVGPFLRWIAANALEVNLGAGGAYTDFQPASSTSESTEHTSFYGGLTVNHKLTDHIAYTLSARHEIRPGVNLGTDYIESTEISLDMRWQMLRHLTLNTRINGELSEEVGLDQSTSEEYNHIGLTTGATYSFTKRFSLLLNYVLAVRNSEDEDRSYTENRVTVGASYRF